MNVDYSRQFVKSAQKLSGKYKTSLQRVVTEVKEANDIKDVTDCIKMSGLHNTYRIRIGDYRIILEVITEDYHVNFRLLLSRGEVYKKKHKSDLE